MFSISPPSPLPYKRALFYYCIFIFHGYIFRLDSFFLFQNIPLEVTVPGKKRWSERLKLGGKSDPSKEDKRDNFTMHEYKNKYGTLSGGSALSKSMKYAETWLYGTVSMKPNQNRPSLFMYPEPAPSQTLFLPPPQPAGYALVMCSCPDFLSGTTRSKKSAAVCKKCGGSRRTAWSASSPSAVRGFGTVRLAQPKSRPELPVFPIEELTDPYDMMRKSRLSTTTLRTPPEGRSRAKSSSPPGRQRRRSQSPVLRHRSPENRNVDRRSLNLNANEDPAKRKSILECDVNPYELISKYLKHDEILQQRIHRGSLLEEDEFSDDLSENVFGGDKSVGKNRGRTRQVGSDRKNKNKFGTIQSTKKNSLDSLKGEGPLTPSDTVQGGVSIGGQRIRIFNSSDALVQQPSAGASEFFCDSEDVDEIFETDKNESWSVESDREDDVIKTSMIPRFITSSSPKRPPRKSKTNDANKKDRKNDGVSKNRVNFSLDVPTHNRRSNSLTSSTSLEIKSILKKPNSTLNLSEGSSIKSKPVSTFNGLNSNQESLSVSTGSRAATPAGHTAKNFYLPTFKEYKQHNNRKKKQVQFKVTEKANASEDESRDTLADSAGVAEAPEVEVPVESEDIVTIDVSTGIDDDSVRLQYFGDHQDDAQAVNQTVQTESAVVTPEVEEETMISDQGKATLSRELPFLSNETTFPAEL